MSDYQLYRCSSVEEYLEKKQEFELTLQEIDNLRVGGAVVHMHAEVPLPPEGYPDDIVIEALGVYQ